MENKNKQISDKTVYIILFIIITFLIILYIVNMDSNKIASDNTSAKSISTSYEAPKTPKKEVTVADFSTMTKEEIRNWFTQNNINGIISDNYSSDIAKGNFVSQSVPANSTVYERDKVTVIFSLGKEPTLAEKNALKKANSYLSHSSFSYKRLIEQLKYEGFSQDESVYAVNNCGADWNEQAAKKASSYMSYSSFSKTRLKEQLLYEGFTDEQAEYGVKSVGY